MDTAILTWLAAHRSAPLDAAALFFSFVGRWGLVLLAATLVRALIDRKLAMSVWQAVLAVALTLVVVEGIAKPLVDRPRPYTDTPTLAVVGTHPATASFPSGHVAACAAAALLVGSTWPRARAGIWTVVALVAASRLYLGVHYPTDVLGGALLGCAVGWFVRGRTVWRGVVASTRSPA
jgi:undecaprenyl-diphosphatase